MMSRSCADGGCSTKAASRKFSISLPEEARASFGQKFHLGVEAVGGLWTEWPHGLRWRTELENSSIGGNKIPR